MDKEKKSKKEEEDPKKKKSFLFKIKNFILKIFNKKNSYNSELNEIVVFFKENQDLFSKNHNSKKIIDIIKDVMFFYSLIVDEIKIPRNKIISIEIDEIQDIFDIFMKSQISNIMIHEDNLDNIIGFINIKDLLSLKISNQDHNKSSLKFHDIIKKPIFIPTTMKVFGLLSSMKKEKNNVAVIIDEYGGTDGLVVLENIISKIAREFDINENYDHFILNNKSDDEFEIDPLIPINILENKIGEININNDQYETLNGLLISINNEIPKKDNEIILNDQYKCNILDSNSRIIKRILIKRYNL